MRVGEQSAVVWKLLKRRPPAASLSRVGILIGPPKALDWPKPMSSSRTTTTFGAPWGAFTSKRTGGLTSRALSSVMPGGCGSGIGRTVRSTCCATASWLAHRAVRAATRVKVREIRFFKMASVRWTPACVGFGFIDQAILHEAADQCRGQETMCAGGLHRRVVRSVTASACREARPGSVARNPLPGPPPRPARSPASGGGAPRRGASCRAARARTRTAACTRSAAPSS